MSILLACCACADRGYAKFTPVALYLFNSESTIATTPPIITHLVDKTSARFYVLAVITLVNFYKISPSIKKYIYTMCGDYKS